MVDGEVVTLKWSSCSSGAVAWYDNTYTHVHVHSHQYHIIDYVKCFQQLTY